MKKVVNLISMLLIVGLTVSLYATVPTYRTKQVSGVTSDNVIVVDPASGYASAVGTKWATKNTTTLTDVNNGDFTIQGSALLYGICVRADAAGEWVYVRDARGPYWNETETGSAVLEIYVGTANEPVFIPFPNGIYFANDIGVDCLDANVFCCILYDQI